MPEFRKYAIVTGAASGLGRALCVELARDRWHLGIADLNTPAAEETLKLVQDSGGSGEVLELDVTRDQQWAELHRRLRQQWPRLDLLVNNAGVCASGEVGDAPMSDWDWVMSINLRGVALGCHTMLDWLKENPDRSWILNVSSMAGLLTLPCMSAYAASKAGVISLSEALYLELRQHNVGVSVVCPWFIRTNLLESGRFRATSHRAYTERRMKTARNSPESFARIALKDTFRDRFLITLGWRSRFVMTFKALFRQTFLGFVDRLAARQSTEPRSSLAGSASPDAPGQRTRPPSSDGLEDFMTIGT
jgi:NAD(P)-dependent dehydrogenase (short-subunit alcohol dehydrogenase family)